MNPINPMNSMNYERFPNHLEGSTKKPKAFFGEEPVGIGTISSVGSDATAGFPIIDGIKFALLLPLLTIFPAFFICLALAFVISALKLEAWIIYALAAGLVVSVVATAWLLLKFKFHEHCHYIGTEGFCISKRSSFSRGEGETVQIRFDAMAHLLKSKNVVHRGGAGGLIGGLVAGYGHTNVSFIFIGHEEKLLFKKTFLYKDPTGKMDRKPQHLIHFFRAVEQIWSERLHEQEFPLSDGASMTFSSALNSYQITGDTLVIQERETQNHIPFDAIVGLERKSLDNGGEPALLVQLDEAFLGMEKQSFMSRLMKGDQSQLEIPLNDLRNAMVLEDALYDLFPEQVGED